MTPNGLPPDDPNLPVTSLFGVPHPPVPGTITYTPSDTAADLPPPVVPFSPADANGSPYTLTGELARGAVGMVWAGWDNRLGRKVAVKVLLDRHLHRQPIRRRFLAEARITAHLQHPSIVPVYEISEFAGGRPYFAMRLVRGMTLAQLLSARPHPGHERHRLLVAFEQVCNGVAHAHHAGVVHRDLKPANIMLAEYGRVKVMDWGVAKLLPGLRPDSPLLDLLTAVPPVDDSRNGRVFGTPAFMAPEQAAGEDDRVDERADVFGLGAVLCTILTGDPPYTGTDPGDVYQQALLGDTADAVARLRRCGAGPELVSLCVRCLAADPQYRPRDAGELYAELTDYLDADHSRAERDLSRFFELSLDLFCIAGMDGFFRRVNANFSRVLGYPTEVMLDRPFLEFVHPDDREATVAVMAAQVQGLDCVQFVNRYRDVRGEYRWFEWTAKSVPEDGNIYAVARDVTERVRLEEQVRTMRNETAP